MKSGRVSEKELKKIDFGLPAELKENKKKLTGKPSPTAKLPKQNENLHEGPYRCL